MKACYPDGHRVVQDNDPKHCSKLARKHYAANGINWWPTPLQSSDLNLIELVWYELKEYICREVKPHNNKELITGIKAFWNTVSRAKCQRYIGHLKKVIPNVIECDGSATEY